MNLPHAGQDPCRDIERGRGAVREAREPAGPAQGAPGAASMALPAPSCSCTPALSTASWPATWHQWSWALRRCPPAHGKASCPASALRGMSQGSPGHSSGKPVSLQDQLKVRLGAVVSHHVREWECPAVW